MAPKGPKQPWVRVPVRKRSRDAEDELMGLLGDGIGSQLWAPVKPWKRPPKPKKPKPEKLSPQQIAERFLEKVRRNDPLH